ncbi:MAG: AAA family ATPase [Clostridia bacterium]|nr:AAA family ATPase [Clostridia bacterium]
MEDNKNDLVVIFAGYSKEMQEFIRTNSGIKSRIGYTFEFADYTEDELFEIFKLKSSKMGLLIDESAEIKLREIINFGRSRKNFGNGRYIDNLLQKALTKQSELNLDDDNVLTLTDKSIPTIEEIITLSSGERHPEKIEEIFKEIVGMENIKKEIISLGKYAIFRDKLSKGAKKNLPEMRLHMLFCGDAGTGKTTMARCLTDMLYNLGCIRINKLVEVERKDLVGEHIGQTAPKTEKVIEGALRRSIIYR